MPEKAEEIVQKGLQQAEEMRQYLSNEGISKIHYVDEKTQNVTFDLSEKKVTLTNEKTGEENVYKVDLQTVT